MKGGLAVAMPSLWSRAFTVVRGVVYSALFVWLWAWVAGWVRTYDSRIPVSLPPWLRPVGYAVAAAGAVLAGLCIATFVTRGRGTPAPFDPPREFVASGPYRWVRNPMYLGALAVICGAGLYLRSIGALVVAVFFILVMQAFVLWHEEPSLEARFGGSYLRYKRTVGRWIPRRRIGS